MKEINYNYKKFRLKIIIPKEIILFMKASNINKDEIFDKNFWQMEAEDSVFFSHDKPPLEIGWVSHGPYSEPLSKSKKIKLLIHGLYFNSSKIFELSPKDFIKEDPLVTSSSNINGGWRIYFSFYE